jgi:hypothetical protein
MENYTVTTTAQEITNKTETPEEKTAKLVKALTEMTNVEDFKFLPGLLGQQLNTPTPKTT